MIIDLAKTHLLPNSKYFVSDKNEDAGSLYLQDKNTLVDIS